MLSSGLLCSIRLWCFANFQNVYIFSKYCWYASSNQMNYLDENRIELAIFSYAPAIHKFHVSTWCVFFSIFYFIQNWVKIKYFWVNVFGLIYVEMKHDWKTSWLESRVWPNHSWRYQHQISNHLLNS